MADNPIVKIMTALLKHQVKKLMGEDALGAIGEELSAIGGDKLDEQVKAWLGEKTTAEDLEKAAGYALDNFREKVKDDDLRQWMAMLPLGDLPEVVAAIEELPTSPDETKLEKALRTSIEVNWKKLSPDQIDEAVGVFMSSLRSALLPLEKQTLTIIGRAVLRTEDKVDFLLRLFDQYVVTAKLINGKQLKSEPADNWNLKHPYPMLPNFTGRVAERALLTQWLNEDNENRLFILRALGGFGKSALTWHWLTNDVNSTELPKVIFWSFYEGDASFENFIRDTLKYLNLEIPQGGRPQVDELLKAMQTEKILLVMDGFERALRIYSNMNAAYQEDEELKQEDNQLDCVNINAEIFLKSVCSLPNIKSKVLMTTRLTPRAIKQHGEFVLGCREVELTVMQKEDAVEFFLRQKIKGMRAEIEVACEPYGYHPLSLRLLAGRIIKDFENPADIVVAQKFRIAGDLKQQKHHVLEISYNGLLLREQNLLSTIACFRSPVELVTLQIVVENKDTLEIDLHDLVDRGLLHFDDQNRKFDLHPIVRRYAYERLSVPDSTAVHSRLRDYFTAIEVPTHPKTLDDLATVIELYYHTVRTGELDKAYDIFTNHLKTPLYFQMGIYRTIIELLGVLFIDGEGMPPRLGEESKQALVLNSLANSYSLSGQPRRAVPMFEGYIATSQKRNDKTNEAVGLTNLASMGQVQIGALLNAEQNLKRAVDLCKSDEFRKSVGHLYLGNLLIYRGAWEESGEELNVSQAFAEDNKVLQMQYLTSVYGSLRALMMTRDSSQSKNNTNNLKSAIQLAERSLELADENAKTQFPIEVDFVRAHWLLGRAYNLDGQLKLAENNLNEALTRCRAINNVESESNILIALARLHYEQNNHEEAKSLAEEALTITERCGYVLQGADVNLFLAQYALEQKNDKAKAKEYAETALKLAYCDGPPYYYKVAYHEAERMLEKLK